MNQPPITPIRQKLTLPFGYHPKRHDIQTCIITSRHRAMNISTRLCFALLAAALVFGGCTRPPHTSQVTAPDTKPKGARLTTAAAIRIAKAAAEHHGCDLRSYKEPEAHYEFTRKDKSWWVYFENRVAKPGNFFAVSVDDLTGETQLNPGD